jgi:steroid Delta-isomerase
MEKTEALARYIRFFETLTPGSLDDIETLFATDASFRDPFNDVRGAGKIRKVFEDMFEAVGQPQFRVTETAWSGQNLAFMRWIFTYRIGGRGAPVRVEGMSAVELHPDGRIASHIDYWDAAHGLYEHLPVIGWVLRALRRKIAA